MKRPGKNSADEAATDAEVGGVANDATAGVDGLGISPVKKDYGGKTEEEYVRTGFFPKMKRVVSKIPFASDAIAMYYAGFDSATPTWARAVAVAALAYFILPIDFIPDALVVIGYTDDATILAIAFKLLSNYVRPEHKSMAREWLTAA